MNLPDPTSLLGIAFILLFFLLILVYTWVYRRRQKANLREIPAFGRLSRSIGIAVESGKRLHLGLGRGELNGLPAGSAFIGLSLLRRIAQAASISDRPPVATSGQGILTVLSQDTFSGAYRSIGAPGQYDPTQGRLTGVTPFSYAAGALPVLFDEDVSANVLAGHFGAEAALIADAGERKGVMTLAGSDNLPGQAVLFASSQEPLIGEELFAAGAYVQAGATHIASLHVQDIFRFLIALTALVGAALKLAGIL